MLYKRELANKQVIIEYPPPHAKEGFKFLPGILSLKLDCASVNRK